MGSLFHFLSNLLLFFTLATLVFAFGAYGALALRRRTPGGRRRAPAPGTQGALLRRYQPREKDCA